MNAFTFTGLVCPECSGEETVVKDSRPIKSEVSGIRRRRLCGKCGRRFTTHELVVSDEDAAGRLRNNAADYARRLAALPEQHRHSVLLLITACEEAVPAAVPPDPDLLMWS